MTTAAARKAPNKAESAEQAAVEGTDQEKRDKALTQAYTKATSRLRDAHREEFNTMYQKAAAELGIEWHPRLSEEQKAEQEFDRLLRTYPHLAARVAPGEVDLDG